MKWLTEFSDLSHLFNAGDPQKPGPLPILNENDEETLCNYITSKAAAGQAVDMSWIKRMAVRIAKSKNIEFRTTKGGPSNGWIERFMERHPKLKPITIKYRKRKDVEIVHPAAASHLHKPASQLIVFHQETKTEGLGGLESALCESNKTEK